MIPARLTRLLLALALTLPGALCGEGTLGRSSMARCSLFGGDFINTFDESMYSFEGSCSYLLAGDCQTHSFSLIGDFQDGKRVSLSVYLGEFFNIHVFVNGTALQGDQRVSMPYTSKGLYLETEAGYYKLSSEAYGFVARIDGSGNFQVLLSDRHFNKTCGLCGNFNIFAEDDFRTQEGILTSDPYDFANSWALSSGEQRCQRASPPSSMCNVSSELQKGLWEQCQLLKSASVFARCHPLVDPEPFVALCERMLCTCDQGLLCPCPVLLEYARACAQQGMLLYGWTDHSSCRPDCPVGMEYKACVSPCPRDCRSLHVSEVCQQQCVDGCSCPEGQLLDGGRCVESAECSCVHSGKRYPPGASLSRDCNTCICRNSQWVCSNEECPGECLITGQSHFKSFDNRHFTFSGVCQYLLARDCQDHSFSIIIETVQCADDPDAVCTRSVTIRLPSQHSNVVKLKHGGGVAMDGQDIQIPLLQGDLRIQHTVMASVHLSYGEDLQIDWDGRGRLLVKLSPVYSGRTCGLCGNYNGNQGDDFLTPAGLAEPLVEHFGNSWKLRADCEDLQKQPSDPCSLNPRLTRFADESCAILTSPKFKACHGAVGPLPYLQNCRYDVCSCTNGRDCLCDAVANYAAACARRGVRIGWREPSFCALSCPRGQVYLQCGSPCNLTCRSLSYPDEECTEVCLEGCFCPLGLYLDETGACVPKAQCPCYYDGEIFQPEDVFSDHHTMCYCEDGFMHCSTSGAPGSLLPDSVLGSPLSHRSKRSLSCQPPMVKLVCPADNPRAEGLECAKTCQNYDLECVSMGCVSGCLCPPGMVRQDNRCVALERCPCFHQGREYTPGETVKVDCNTCVCRDRKWNCTDHVCDATCSALGLAHYLTFDGLKYLFPGECQYVLAQDYCGSNPGTFRILVGNEGCGYPSLKCRRRVTILVEGGEIELFDGEVSVKRSMKDETYFEVVESGLYITVLLGKALSVVWDRHLGISVFLKQTYQEQVCGLCGNFDGIQNNDLTSSSLQVEEDPVDFGNSWKVSPRCADTQKVTLDPSPATCHNNVLKQTMVDSSCSVLTSDIFRECNRLVDPEPYLDVCIYDTCSCESVGDCACFCDTIAAYAHVCARHGEVVAWRTATLCPQSCEERNLRDSGYQCEWRYNSCAPACPVTCQHPEPLACPVQCVEGCHAHCPPGKILDELLQTCVNPEDCPVCEAAGRRLAPGKKITLNPGDPERCQICHCDGVSLTCEACREPGGLVVPPTEGPVDLTTPYVDDTPEPPLHDFFCSKLLDLVFLLDGSSKLSEADFEMLKAFVVGVMERLHISQKRIRVAVVEYHDGSHAYIALQDRKRPSELRRIAGQVKYAGSEVASTSEVLKYTLFQIFSKVDRPEASRVALLLTASQEPPRLARNLVRYVQGLKKKKVVMVPVGIGPHASLRQIRLIEKQAPENKAFVLSGVDELEQRRDEIINYLCDLAPEAPAPTQRPLTAQVPVTLAPRRSSVVLDVAFLLEGSDSVGEASFNRSTEFLEEVIRQMDVGRDGVHVTVLQYSYVVTVEHSFREAQSKEDVMRRLREIRYRGGNRTNTGLALQYLSEHSFSASQGDRGQAPNLVYMVTGSPASDEIRRMPGDIQVVPIGVGPRVDVPELEKISWPQAPIFIKDFETLPREAPDLVLQRCCSREGPHLPTPAPVSDCSQPLDVVLLLDGSSSFPASYFDEMKSFAKAFISRANIGPQLTQVSVLQYGNITTIDVPWTVPLEKTHLLSLVDHMQQEGSPSQIGNALGFAVRYVTSQVHGARPEASKVVVILVMGTSTDSLDAAAAAARSNRVAVFPIGIGDGYDLAQLRILAGPGASSNVVQLQRIEDLPTMVALGNSFFHKLCSGFISVCVDEDGNERRPGDIWTLPDRCHTVTCLPDGQTLLNSHRVNCDQQLRPSCPNSQSPIRVEEACGCRWTCPCICTGSSTRHVVTFDGQNFKLTGNCSYVLFHNKEQDLEVLLHNDACSARARQACMKSIEVKHNGVSVELRSNMEVVVNGRLVSAPYVGGDMEVSVYGAIMYEVRLNHLGHILTFTPQNNEFQLQLSPKTFASKMYGLCGICDENGANDFMLRDGTVTSDWKTLVQEWTVQKPGQTCLLGPEEPCPVSRGSHCQVLLSALFAECHAVLAPATFHAICQQDSCHQEQVCEAIASYAHLCRTKGVCVDWRTPDFCAVLCPPSLVYNHCERGCPRQCEGNSSFCGDHPSEGCFCPLHQVLLEGSCVPEEACTQCVGDDGIRHQLLETWVPDHQPCQICTCLSGRKINCTTQPCPTARAPACGPCEVARLRQSTQQCCPEYECVCDLVSCDLPPVPHCEGGLQPTLTNPGECRPNFTCSCRKEECPRGSPPSCPPHRTPVLQKTQCCDEYKCVCNCTSSAVTCPLGYLASTVTNDCGCTTTTCLPDKVCVHQGTIYPVGQFWEEGCDVCTCTDLEDAVMGLRVAQCSQKPCGDSCRPGFTYVLHEGECCGTCLPSACEVVTGSPRGDSQSYWKSVGSHWASPEDPCLIYECVRVKEEVFVQQRNVSCPQLDVPTCPSGFQLSCQTSGCCPTCHCEPLQACVLNGTIIGPGRSLMVDLCTTCLCTVQVGVISGFKLECRQTTCEDCPLGYKEEKMQGQCCGRCLPMACTIQLRGGQIMMLKRDETLQDGCDSHFCRVNKRGEFIWERRVTGCPPFDGHKCLAEGGKIMKIPGTCCDTCEEPECKDITAKLQYVKVGDCLSEEQVDIHYCQGRCTSKALYSIDTEDVQDQCACCAPTRTEPMQVPLRCANGSVIHHVVLNAMQCKCSPRKCRQ
ncbi:von Willebrand factor isoform X1 [Monodon monoceros]|uniref:von Willebrand factor isoform X1 n=1 Tax=Monodon monoceros TaxID=40151 RepID=UPI0010F7CDA0|nr:von Willebrand factor isoform X1 [Monodon monoceros]XP_029060197.1 von Willebrand factor isoform X1 [Monodon monoceros]XP_029060199.1 von Willebrand factor isoform X1 [Monodon monoceros]